MGQDRDAALAAPDVEAVRGAALPLSGSAKDFVQAEQNARLVRNAEAYYRSMFARERHPGEAFLIGFSTHTGTVTAATDWGAPAERKRVRPSLPGSYERLFHDNDVTRAVEPLERGSLWDTTEPPGAYPTGI